MSYSSFKNNTVSVEALNIVENRLELLREKKGIFFVEHNHFINHDRLSIPADEGSCMADFERHICSGSEEFSSILETNVAWLDN
jgi:hypothetical protein